MTLTGWTTSLAVSKSAALAPLSSVFAFLAGGAALAILIALAAVLIIGRRLATPISRLAASADALARGERPQIDVATVREMDELYRALVKAGEAAREVSAERERRQLAETKEAQAQAASRAKDEFLAMLSHELRNPLAALTAAAHVLRGNALSQLDILLVLSVVSIDSFIHRTNTARAPMGTTRVAFRP